MASESKRFKLDECDASRVILITDLLPSIDDRDIVGLMSRYGNVVDMLRISQGRSALLEFDDIDVAKRMVNQSQTSTFYVGVSPVKMAYGNSQTLVRKKGSPISSMSVLGFIPHGGGDSGPPRMQGPPPHGGGPMPPQHQMPPQQPPQQQQMPTGGSMPLNNGAAMQANTLALQGLPGRVLLFAITNAVYPITVEVLKTICSPNGNVLRISIGPKKADNSLEALVEFENVGDATKAIENLNGADIYSGCCTLSITVSHLPVLQVFKNDSESCDFTNPNLGSEKAALLGDSPASAPLISSVPPPNQPIAGAGPYGNQMMSGSYQQPPPMPPAYGPNQGGMGPHDLLPKSQMFLKGEGTVIMAYNLPPNLTCQNIFNIVCLYGNVARVKFLKSREGCAMIQMGTPEQSELVIQNLSALSVCGQKIEVCRSKQPEVQVHAKPDLMPNGTPLSMCYENSINNRFKRADMFTKSRIVAPARTLHFFNFPPSTTENDVFHFFKMNDAPPPDRIVVFKLKQPEQKYSLGLVEFDTVENAVLAVMRSNHVEIKQHEKSRFHAKLSFSTKPIDIDDKNAVTFMSSADQPSSAGADEASASKNGVSTKV